MDVTTQQCPICRADLPASERYPDRLCAGCAARAVDTEGRPLTFYNVAFSGGFRAVFTDDGTDADQVSRDHIVLVDGIRCWADEHRFGGIVVRPAPES
ncbi:hypothetical protein Adi01nite_46790 [Amorphoplanes digitatis]|nr:hypothetical protein Adi01nite_46790 [Actinoplanes digitatis]